jgi:prepilin-type N-terminal cleavage/methylation domain-containing protein
MRASMDRLQDDEGVSLIEMLIALLILGVVLSATASTLISSFVAIGGNENRTRAVALANEELENLRALPWTDVGYYGNDTFPAGMSAASPTVILGSTRPVNARAPRPVRVYTERNPVMTVTRRIEWVDNPSTSSSTGPSDQDYKRLAVNVSWVDPSGATRTLDAETLRAPTPSEGDPSDFVLSLFDVTPEVVHLTDDGTRSTAIAQSPIPLQFSALTSAAADLVRVSFREQGNSTDTVRNLTAPDQSNWSGSYTTGRYPNGDVIFTFTATRALPVEQQVIGRKTVRFLKPMRFTEFTLTPSSPTTCLAEGATTPAVAVRVHVNGVVLEDTVSVSWNGQTIAAAPAALNPVTIDGTRFEAVIPAGSYTTSTSVVVTATRQGTQSLSTNPAGQIVVSRQGDVGCP